jgi:hypothetical protein
MVVQAFSNIHQARHAVATQIIDTTKARIDARAPGLRTLADDVMLSPANDGIILAVSHRDPSMARHIFSECYAHALQYEAANNCQIHKGSMLFNVGLAYLRTYDLTGAMHYFELAEEETRLTSGQKNWSIFLNEELFDPNFWNTLDAVEEQNPLVIHQDLWGKPYSKDAAKKAWRKLSGYSKLLYIISAARRVHLLQLEAGSGWNGSHSLRVGYWNLIADLSRLLETEVKRRADIAPPKPWQLKTLLKQGFTATQRGDISTLVGGFMNARNVHNTATFNAHYPAIKSDVLDAAKPKLERISNAVHLFYVTRNQVQHHIDRKLVLYENVDEAKFTSNVLLSLCRLSSWAKKA